jgi:rRNA maturation endonuclease Nob1
MKHCEKCKTSDLEDHMFCSVCGTTLVFWPRCKFCDNEIHPNFDKFCAFCGRPVDAEMETP